MHLYIYLLMNIPRVVYFYQIFSLMLVKNTFCCNHCLHKHWKIKLLLNDHKSQNMGLLLNEVLIYRIRNAHQVLDVSPSVSSTNIKTPIKCLTTLSDDI